VAKLTDEDAARLVRSLETARRGEQPPPSHAPNRATGAAELARIASLFVDTTACDALGRKLTIALAEYLNRPVRISVSGQPPLLEQPLAFAGASGAVEWRIEVEADLAASFADAMIGGDGSAPLRHGKRIRLLAAALATHLLRVVADEASVPVPRDVRPVESSANMESIVAGGLCAIATAQYGWRLGAVSVVGDADRSAPSIVGQPDDSDGSRTPAALLSPAEPVPNADDEPRRAIEDALAALQSLVADLTHAPVTSPPPDVATEDGLAVAPLADAALRLALTAGGSGALVATLDRDAVAALVSAACGTVMPNADEAGDVVVALAEAIVREALEGAARQLPGIEREGHKIVWLAGDPLPARAPHHTVDVRVTVGGRQGIWRLLVPTWMLHARGAGRAATDADRE
jgi:hypothetical protein